MEIQQNTDGTTTNPLMVAYTLAQDNTQDYKPKYVIHQVH